MALFHLHSFFVFYFYSLQQSFSLSIYLLKLVLLFSFSSFLNRILDLFFKKVFPFFNSLFYFFFLTPPSFLLLPVKYSQPFSFVKRDFKFKVSKLFEHHFLSFFLAFLFLKKDFSSLFDFFTTLFLHFELNQQSPLDFFN